MSSSIEYDLKPYNLPRLAGSLLRFSTFLLENPVTKSAISENSLKQTGITQIRNLVIEEPPTNFPLIRPKVFPPEKSQEELLQISRKSPVKGFSFKTVQDYATAYRNGSTTPEAVAQKIVEAMEHNENQSPSLNTFIARNQADLLTQARESHQRFQANKPLSIFDGVPVAVKDEVDQVPYGTTVGTKFLGKTPAKQDSTVVARMRAAGALLIGKANMHEIGIGVTGINSHHGTTRNPYNPEHHTGGSSSGSATAVAAGFCPVAIAADGGGSIRIPSGFCGVVGLKPTYGRVSEFGAAPLAWSVAHLGPIGATTHDAALAYAIMAGCDEKDQNTLIQPSVSLEDFENLDLTGIRIGVYDPWFHDASSAMVEGCETLLKGLEGLGATVQKIEIPNLSHISLAHVVTIASEMAAAMSPYYKEHRKDFGLDVRGNLALAFAFSAKDYVQAQRIRTKAIADFSKVLETVDLIVTPTTGCVAPPIRPDTIPDGESNLRLLSEIMRFATPGNLTGFPAISFPAGYDEKGLPIGFQAMARPWEEPLLLRLSHSAEQLVERQKPQVHYQFLPSS